MMRLLSVFLTLLLATTALAGCVDDAPAAEDDSGDGNLDDTNQNNQAPDEDDEGEGETSGEEGSANASGVAPEDAQAYLVTAMDAAKAEPEVPRVRIVGEFSTGPDAAPGLVMDVAFDEDAGAMKLEFTADPSNMPAEARQQMGGMSGTMGAYAYGDVSAFILQDMVIVNHTPDADPFAALEEGAEQGGPEVPTSPEDVFSMLQADENLTVTASEMIEHEGREALEVAFEYATGEDAVQTGLAIVYLEPEPMLASIEATQDSDAPGSQGMGYARMTFAYGDDVRVEFDEAVQRAMGLAWEKEETDNVTATFTFQTPDGWAQVTPADLTLEVMHADAFAQSAMFGSEPSPLLEMRLGDGSGANDNVTATFTDVDGDGFVSAGDTLVVESHDPANLTAADLAVSLTDDQTGLNVVPGPAVAFAGLAAVGAALLARRRE